MANQCDSPINFGKHAVDQGSVLGCLNLDPGDGGVEQSRPTSENSHYRIMTTRNNVQYWTLGLSHRELRDQGKYSVYRRVGAKNQFTFVSGKKLPDDNT